MQKVSQSFMTNRQMLGTQQLVEITRRHGLVYLALFGFHAHGDAHTAMDDALGVDVDLITDSIPVR